MREDEKFSWKPPKKQEEEGPHLPDWKSGGDPLKHQDWRDGGRWRYGGNWNPKTFEKKKPGGG
jgi:hypothetical protein